MWGLHNAIEQKAALCQIRQPQMLHEQGNGCALYGTATLGTLQLKRSVMLPNVFRMCMS